MEGQNKRVKAGLIHFIPACHAALILAGVVLTWPLGWVSVAAWVIVALYLLPPLLARFVFRWASPLRTRSEVYSHEFFIWWTVLQFQALFLLFPCLESILRLVPELYSAWLRLWGARVGTHVFWSAGTKVLDRSLLDVGDRVTIGFGVTLSGHLLSGSAERGEEIVLAPLRIGSDSLIGAGSAIGPGARIAAGSRLPGDTRLLPMHAWEENRKRGLQEEQMPGFVSLPAWDVRPPITPNLYRRARKD